ncbi:hypothetical protein O3Q51_13700 [Cryomorphaceae bacterium 1068]|nr:hypothetical protein [Cryomorphaceae bacterium 1068]
MISSLLLWFMLHPFHVGLTDINYNSDSESYQVSLKLFTDDLEKGLEEFSDLSIDLFDSSSTDLSDSLISVYVDQHFSISAADRVDLKYIGSEREYDVTWIYLESDKTQMREEIHVQNEILMSVFSDQSHIVHFKYGNENQSGLISSEKTIAIFQKSP